LTASCSSDKYFTIRNRAVKNSFYDENTCVNLAHAFHALPQTLSA
jgi:hypothetical protein